MTILIGVIIGTFVMAGLDLIFPIVVRYLINEILPSKNMHQLFIGSGVLLFYILLILSCSMQCSIMGIL